MTKEFTALLTLAGFILLAISFILDDFPKQRSQVRDFFGYSTASCGLLFAVSGVIVFTWKAAIALWDVMP